MEPWGSVLTCQCCVFVSVVSSKGSAQAFNHSRLFIEEITYFLSPRRLYLVPLLCSTLQKCG